MPRTPTIPEKAIQRAICEWLTLAEIPWTVTDAAHVTINGVTRGRAKICPGWPDITAVLAPEGVMLAIEVKSATGKLRADQEAILGQLKAAGAVVVVARSIENVVGEVVAYYRTLTDFGVNDKRIPDSVRRAVYAMLR